MWYNTIGTKYCKWYGNHMHYRCNCINVCELVYASSLSVYKLVCMCSILVFLWITVQYFFFFVFSNFDLVLLFIELPIICLFKVHFLVSIKHYKIDVGGILNLKAFFSTLVYLTEFKALLTWDSFFILYVGIYLNN